MNSIKLESNNKDKTKSNLINNNIISTSNIPIQQININTADINDDNNKK
jgi:hypothetical protein